MEPLPPLPPTPVVDSNANANANANAADNQMDDDVPMNVSDESFDLPDFDAEPEEFDALEAAKSPDGELAQLAGFDPQFVKFTLCKMKTQLAMTGSMSFFRVHVHFRNQDGTRKSFRAKETGDCGFLRAIEYAVTNGYATRGQLNLGVLVPKEAINFANGHMYPKDQCAVMMRKSNRVGNGTADLTRIVHLKMGYMAINHVDFCAQCGLDFGTLLSYEIVERKINAGILGLPFFGPFACTVHKSENERSRNVRVYQSDGTLISMTLAYHALRIVQMNLLRETVHAVLGLRRQPAREFLRNWCATSSVEPFGENTLYRFLGAGGILYYSVARLLAGKTRLGPYQITNLQTHLHSTLQEGEYDASPVLGGLMLCLNQRVRPGDPLPKDSDCVLRPAAIRAVRVDGGELEEGLVYHPQSGDAEYEVENGPGYSAVQLNTILVANVKSLIDINGDAIDNSDDQILVRYDGMNESEDGSDYISLRVFYTEKDDEEVVYLTGSGNEVWSDVVAKNLFVAARPGSLPIFYEDSDELKQQIELRDSLSAHEEEDADGFDSGGSTIAYCGTDHAVKINGSSSGLRDLAVYDWPYNHGDFDGGCPDIKAAGGVLIQAEGTTVESTFLQNVFIYFFVGGQALTLSAINQGGVGYSNIQNVRLRHAMTGLKLEADETSFVNTNTFVGGAISGGDFHYGLHATGPGDCNDNKFYGLGIGMYDSEVAHVYVTGSTTNVKMENIRFEAKGKDMSRPIVIIDDSSYGNVINGILGHTHIKADMNRNPGIDTMSQKSVGLDPAPLNQFWNAAFKVSRHDRRIGKAGKKTSAVPLFGLTVS